MQRRIVLLATILLCAFDWAHTTDGSVVAMPAVHAATTQQTPGVTPVVSADATQSNEPELSVSTHSNGQTHMERWIIQSAAGGEIEHGEFREYDSRGQLIREGTYHVGKRDGKWFQLIDRPAAERLVTGLDADFQPPFRSTVTFDQGRLSAYWTLDDTRGRKVFIWRFEAGQRHGDSMWFDPSGRIILQLRYRADRVAGPAVVQSSAAAATLGGANAEDASSRPGLAYVTTTAEQTGSPKRRQPVTSWDIDSHDWRNSRVEYRTAISED
jgi:hypothetical protein